MRKLILSLAAVSLVLFAEKALCRGTAFAIEPESFNALTHQDFRVKEVEPRTRGTGRFLSVDPVLDQKLALSNPQAWNRYAYVRNNPINKTDPTGRREALLYGVVRDVEPGDLVVLLNKKTHKPVHVVVVGGFKEGKKGEKPSALIYENVPKGGARGSNTPTLTNSNDPKAGAGIWNAARMDVGGIVNNDNRIRLDHATILQDFTEQRVANAVNAVGAVQYDATFAGVMGPRCDCAGFANQVAHELGGTAQYRTWYGTEFDVFDWLRSTQ